MGVLNLKKICRFEAWANIYSDSRKLQEKGSYQDYTHVVVGVFKETFTSNLPEAEK